MNNFKKIKLANTLKKAMEVGSETLEAAWEIVKDPKSTNVAFNITKLAKKGIEAYTKSLSSSDHICENWTWAEVLGLGKLDEILEDLKKRVEVNAEELGDSSLFKIDSSKKRRSRY